MDVSSAIEEYRYAISQLSRETQVWYLRMLGVFAQWSSLQGIALEQIKPSDIGRFLEMIRTTHTNPHTGEPVTSHTVSGYARTIKAFLNWCSREDGIEQLVSIRLPSRIAMPRIDEKVIEIFSDEQIHTFFKACEQEYLPALVARDKAILAVLLDTGIRASELCDLTLDCVHLDARDGYIKVLGKGRKEREIGLGKQARATIQRYISRYRKASKTEQHVFLTRQKKPFTVNGLDQMMKRLSEWGHIEGVRCSCHTWRHSFAINYLKNGGDVYKLSRLMGHSSVSVTETYLRAFKSKDARADGLSVLDRMKKPP